MKRWHCWYYMIRQQTEVVYHVRQDGHQPVVYSLPILLVCRQLNTENEGSLVPGHAREFGLVRQVWPSLGPLILHTQQNKQDSRTCTVVYSVISRGKKRVKRDTLARQRAFSPIVSCQSFELLLWLPVRKAGFLAGTRANLCSRVLLFISH